MVIVSAVSSMKFYRQNKSYPVPYQILHYPNVLLLLNPCFVGQDIQNKWLLYKERPNFLSPKAHYLIMFLFVWGFFVDLSTRWLQLKMAGVCVPWGAEACRLHFPIRRELPVSFALPKSSSMIVNDNLSAFLEV